MARQSAWVLALVLMCAPALVGPAGAGEVLADRTQGPARGDGRADKAERANKPEDRERWKWWLYDRAELGITDQQSAEINRIFESTLPKLRETRQELERADEELSRTIKEHKADIATISMLVDRAESARWQHTKTRVVMLYRIDQILSPEQRVKLEALRARRDAARAEDASRRDKGPSQGRRHP